MNSFSINVKSNIDAFQRKIGALAYKQLPFATAQALTAIAKQVVKDERVNEVKVLDRPRPFTSGAIGVVKARKESMRATVYMRDVTAAYLEPYEFGGRNVLNSKALLKPVGAVKNLDDFGNLPRNLLRSLKGRSDVFIGAVQTKRGLINGVWQRAVEEGARVQTGVSKKTGKARYTKRGTNTTDRLVLLIRFEDAHPVRQHLGWFNVAQRTIDRNFNREMGRALARAIASAR